VSGQRRQFQERRLRIKQQRNPLARRQLAARHVFCRSLVAAAALDLFELAAQFLDLPPHGVCVTRKFGRARIDRGRQDERLHGHPALNSSAPISMRRISLVPAPIS
jgi:hypothetical protein